MTSHQKVDFEKVVDRSLLNDYLEFLRFASVSTKNAEYKEELQKAVKWLVKKLKEYGFSEVRALGLKEGEMFVDYYPLVYAQYEVSKDAPTLLFYGHYDVQPADEQGWLSDPFAPTIKNGRVYARGASDNKGRLFATLLGIKRFLESTKNSPINIKLIIEGEEEIGSKNAPRFIREYQDLFDHTALFLNDMTRFKDTPTIVYSLRGVLYVELKLFTAKKDLHSGTYGNLVLNCANLAGYVVYKLKDIFRNRIRIEGIYRYVRRAGKDEIARLSKISDDWNTIKETTKAYVVTPYKGARLKDFAPMHLVSLLPSLDVHGIKSGSYEEGVIKASIPHTATIKFSLRTVPYLDNKKLKKLLEAYIEKILKKFKGVKYELRFLVDLPYYYEDVNSEYMKQFAKVVEDVYQQPVLLVPNGASVGMVGFWRQVFTDKPILIHALGSYDDNVHAANESFSLEDLYYGALVVERLLKEYSGKNQ